MIDLCHGYLSMPWLSYRGLLSSGALESQCRSSFIVSYNINYHNILISISHQQNNNNNNNITIRYGKLKAGESVTFIPGVVIHKKRKKGKQGKEQEEKEKKEKEGGEKKEKEPMTVHAHQVLGKSIKSRYAAIICNLDNPLDTDTPNSNPNSSRDSNSNSNNILNQDQERDREYREYREDRENNVNNVILQEVVSDPVWDVFRTGGPLCGRLDSLVREYV